RQCTIRRAPCASALLRVSSCYILSAPEYRKIKRPFPPTARAHPVAHPAPPEATSQPFSRPRSRLAGRPPLAARSVRRRARPRAGQTGANVWDWRCNGASNVWDGCHWTVATLWPRGGASTLRSENARGERLIQTHEVTVVNALAHAETAAETGTNDGTAS